MTVLLILNIYSYSQTPSLREQLYEELNYEPLNGFSIGLGFDFNKENANFLITTQAYHIDFMGSVYIIGDETKKYGNGRCRDYTGILGPNGFPGDRYIESYRTTAMGGGIYLGYLVKRFSFGGYIGYEQYETGKTYYDNLHILSSNGFYSVNVQCHSKCVLGIYSKFFLSPHGHILLSYKFGIGIGFGLAFTFSNECR